MARSKTILSANLNAFLDALAWAEGTSTHTLTINDGYDVIVTGVDGKEIFSDYSAHPFSHGRKPKHVSGNLYSTASGRYQHMLRDYVHYRDLLELPDFGPASQDRWAVQLIKERRALPAIEDGNIKAAVGLCRNLWASLPGAGYGQQERSISDFLSVYLDKGGKLWDSKYMPPLAPLSPQLPPTLPVPLEQKPKPMPTPELPKQSGWLSQMLKLLTRK